jgi:NAD-dependent dihydropyrimidine dehydrogenase PreA subunit
MNACILCRLCITACREERGSNVIGLAGRGAQMRIVFDFDVPLGESTCIGCGACVRACPTGALAPAPGRAVSAIDQDECVECGVCGRADVCGADALYMPELEWPRTVRAAFSDPVTVHKTGVAGRGTEEMKTNDVTGRFQRGEFGVGIEMGRPGISARFRDLEKVSMAVAAAGAEFEEENPVTSLMVERETGRIDPEVLDEKVLSAIIEFKIDQEGLERILRVLQEVAPELDTVFSLAVSSMADPDGSVATKEIGEGAGYAPRINGKTNVGLGRRA